MTRLLLLPWLASSVVLRRTPLTPLKVTGRDAGAFLHAMLSADVSTLPQMRTSTPPLDGPVDATDLTPIARCQEEWPCLRGRIDRRPRAREASSDGGRGVLHNREGGLRRVAWS